MKVAVVTPTIASKHLKQCIDSVNKQTYKDITHYIFVDGCQYEPEARKILKQSPKTKMIELEENVGKGWYGHRVYAACSFLVNADVICYLDEDNWYEPNHIEELVNVIKEGNDWASHGSDSFRYLALGMEQNTTWSQPITVKTSWIV